MDRWLILRKMHSLPHDEWWMIINGIDLFVWLIGGMMDMTHSGGEAGEGRPRTTSDFTTDRANNYQGQGEKGYRK